MIDLLVIGDSISADCRKYLPDYVNENIQIHHKKGINEAYKNLDIAVGANNGDSSTVLEYLRRLDANQILKYDYCIFNCGLHDVKRDSQQDFVLQVGEELYEANLHEIIGLLNKNKIKSLWINSTPSYRERYSASDFVRFNEDVIRYNQIAGNVMQEHNIKIIDLYHFTLSLKLSGDALFRDHTHFQEEVIRLQAAYIAGAVNLFVSE